MTIRDHAIAEFVAAKWIDNNGNYTDSMQQEICNGVLRLIDIFADEGHSGTTAPYAIELFRKLASYEPITPLTGEDSEWSEVGNGVFQNKRCSRVFKQQDTFDGRPYDLDGKVFWNWVRSDDGDVFKSHYGDSNSRVPITFPYTPVTEYVFVPTDEFPTEER